MLTEVCIYSHSAGWRWYVSFWRLVLFAVLLLPGFAQMAAFYFFSPRMLRSIPYGLLVSRIASARALGLNGKGNKMAAFYIFSPCMLCSIPYGLLVSWAAVASSQATALLELGSRCCRCHCTLHAAACLHCPIRPAAGPSPTALRLPASPC